MIVFVFFNNLIFVFLSNKFFINVVFEWGNLIIKRMFVLLFDVLMIGEGDILKLLSMMLEDKFVNLLEWRLFMLCVINLMIFLVLLNCLSFLRVLIFW